MISLTRGRCCRSVVWVRLRWKRSECGSRSRSRRHWRTSMRRRRKTFCGAHRRTGRRRHRLRSRHRHRSPRDHPRLLHRPGQPCHRLPPCHRPGQQQCHHQQRRGEELHHRRCPCGRLRRRLSRLEAEEALALRRRPPRPRLARPFVRTPCVASRRRSDRLRTFAPPKMTWGQRSPRPWLRFRFQCRRGHPSPTTTRTTAPASSPAR